MQKPKIFVGNVGYNTTPEAIKEIFAPFGTVVDCFKPQMKGFAFVTMGSVEEAEKALSELQSKEVVVDGRPLKFDEAQDRKDRPARPQRW